MKFLFFILRLLLNFQVSNFHSPRIFSMVLHICGWSDTRSAIDIFMHIDRLSDYDTPICFLATELVLGFNMGSGLV